MAHDPRYRDYVTQRKILRRAQWTTHVLYVVKSWSGQGSITVLLAFRIIAKWVFALSVTAS